MAHLDEREVFAKTIYDEARGESREGQAAVGWVIKNRAKLDKDYWGGSSIKGVCLKEGQFECWNGKSDIDVREPGVYQGIRQLANEIYDAPHRNDPTGGADHYNNPSKEGYPGWTQNCNEKFRIGGHVFYKDKNH